MHIIKLNAIESTSTFLKDLAKSSCIKNHTIVTAETQFGGRGQMGTVWESEPGKNLIFSLFVENDSFLLEHAVYLNYAVSIAIYNTLIEYKLPKLAIKWPNDILSDSNKICGLLIENSIRLNKINHSIIGVGINVNQEHFSENLITATSIKNQLGITINKEDLLDNIGKAIISEINECVPENFSILKNRYLSILYKYQKPTMFQQKDGVVFMGKIVDVNEIGELCVEREDESISYFGLKEIKML